jgi:hypothetical protein
MTKAFTLCSNNYYAQALALARSFLLHHPNCIFYIVLVDKKIEMTSIDDRIVTLEIEEIESDILSLALRYNIVELNTAVKPQVFLYLFNNTNADTIYYIDPDIYIYDNFTALEDYLNNYDILLTPHILTPIPIDGKTPMENDFLNFGLYNLGFLALKRSASNFQLLEWWKERTYQFGYKDLAKGLFVDQLWMNFIPLFFERVKIILHPGYNMGPWNLHERYLTVTGDKYFIGGTDPLYFFHFSTMNPSKDNQLHPVFNRFTIANRPDLAKLYRDYKKEIMILGYNDYHGLTCYYIKWRAEQLLKEAKDAYNHLPVNKKVVRKIKKAVPETIRKAILGFIQA